MSISRTMRLFLVLCTLGFTLPVHAEQGRLKQTPDNPEQHQLDTLTGQNRAVMPFHDILGICMRDRQNAAPSTIAANLREKNVFIVDPPADDSPPAASYRELLIYLTA